MEKRNLIEKLKMVLSFILPPIIIFLYLVFAGIITPPKEGSVVGTLLKLLFTLVFAFIGFFIILIILKIFSIFFNTIFIGVSIMKKGCHIF